MPQKAFKGWVPPALSAAPPEEGGHASSRWILFLPQGPWWNTAHSGEQKIKMCGHSGCN